MIRIHQVSKRYGDKLAVDDLSLDIPPGEIFAFLGPNGAGKTTTIKMVAGLVKPNSGKIEVGGHDVHRKPIEARRALGYVPDQPFLYDKLSGREFFRFLGRLYGMPDRDVLSEGDRWIKAFQMEDWIDDYAETYSHGMKQRVVLAATLLHRPTSILLDEPLVGLDPASIRLVQNLIREEAKRGVAFLISTHVLAFAEDLAHRVGIIHESKMRAVGTMEELRTRFGANGTLEDVFFKITEP